MGVVLQFLLHFLWLLFGLKHLLSSNILMGITKLHFKKKGMFLYVRKWIYNMYIYTQSYTVTSHGKNRSVCIRKTAKDSDCFVCQPQWRQEWKLEPGHVMWIGCIRKGGGAAKSIPQRYRQVIPYICNTVNGNKSLYHIHGLYVIDNMNLVK